MPTFVVVVIEDGKGGPTSAHEARCRHCAKLAPIIQSIIEH